MTEEQLQAKCVQWFWNNYPQERLMWHHNNNNSLNRIAGAKAKALGVVKGVWDIEWLTPAGVTIWIELKVNRNTLTDEQFEFRRKTLERVPLGFHLFLVARDDPSRGHNGLEEFQKIIKTYYR